MQIANKKDVILEIANRYELAFPCIKHALETDNARSEIIAVQHRLLTYKEVLLHGSMLEEKELKQAFSALNENEKASHKAGFEVSTTQSKRWMRLSKDTVERRLLNCASNLLISTSSAKLSTA